MSEMIDRAHAAFVLEVARIERGVQLNGLTVVEEVRLVKAVINALRTPTDDMIQAMHDGAMGGLGEVMGDSQRQYCVDCWADMIVAAGADQ